MDHPKRGLDLAQALNRMTRFYDMLSQVNQLVVRTHDPQVLLQGACDIAVRAGGFQLAWVGGRSPGSPRVRVVAKAGTVAYLDGLEFYTDDRPEGRGPTGTCLRENRVVICNDFRETTSFKVWRERAERFGLHASISVPIRVRNAPLRALMAYSGETGLFGEAEVQLFERAAADLAFGLDHLELERTRERDRKALADSQAIAHVGDWTWDPIEGTVRCSEELQRMLALEGPLHFGAMDTLLQGRVHPDDLREVLECYLLAGQHGVLRDIEFRLVAPGGERRVRAVFGDRLTDAEGRVTRLSGIIQDNTELREAEAQLLQTQKMEAIGTLASGVAHDMNNVLAAILAMASLHQEDPELPAELSRTFKSIMGACLRGRDLLKGLLTFTRKSLAHRGPVDLNHLVIEQLAILERTTHQLVRFERELDPVPCWVIGDPSALSAALMNLCVNAVDAMPDGGVLSLRTRHVGDSLELRVADTGCGMPPGVLAQAVDPFFTTKPEGKGTGLGLAIVYRVAHAHHGEVHLHSRVGEGTIVTLYLPALGDLEAFVPGSATTTEAVAAATPSALDLLVVDDDDLVLSSTTMLLESLGHQVTAVSSGEAALAALTQGLRPDAVILDMNMPGLGGRGTLPNLRSLRPDLPVLLCTGRADHTAQDLVAQHRGVTLLPKPFSLDDLTLHLSQVAPAWDTMGSQAPVHVLPRPGLR